jgi:putative hydrolase of the HAD superfamily
MRISQRYPVILLDMNSTFMFGEDRFGSDHDFFETYLRLGGGELPRHDVDLAIRSCFQGMLALSRDHTQVDRFVSVEEGLQRYAGLTSASVVEIARLVDVFTEHELGHVPATYASFLRELSRDHELGVVSNIYAPKRRWMQEFDRAGIAGIFKKLVFSSDSRSMKPSPALFLEALAAFDVHPSEILFTGDSLKRDIKPAKALGLSTAWINRQAADSAAHEPAADFIIPSLLSL